MSSARSFLKVGLFLGWYCQQLFMSLAISKGQKRGAGMRYPETHRSQSKQAVRDFWHVYTPSGTQSSGNGLSRQIRQVSDVFFLGGGCLFVLFVPFSTSFLVSWLLMLVYGVSPREKVSHNKIPKLHTSLSVV